MRHASLFSGIGGFDLAAEWMGWENVFSCEYMPFPRKVLGHYFPSSNHHEKIQDLDGTKYAGTIDVLTGGFPCQPFSAAGRRRGASDDRFLWPEMLRVIREVRPTWVVGENVAGLLSMVQYGGETEVEAREYSTEQDARAACEKVHREGRGRRTGEGILHAILGELAEAGYAISVFSIPACAVEAPHERKRLWLVAYRCCERRQQNAGCTPHDEGTDGRRKKRDHVPTGEAQEPTPDAERIGRRARSKKRTETGARDGRERCARDDTDTDNPRLEGREITGSDGKNWKEPHDEHAGGCDRPHATDSHKRGLEGPSLSSLRDFGEAERHARRWSSETWLQAAARLCRVDDVLPGKLDGITVSSWRKESLKAYGNAIVPQIAYEIFKAIQASQ